MASGKTRERSKELKAVNMLTGVLSGWKSSSGSREECGAGSIGGTMRNEQDLRCFSE